MSERQATVIFLVAALLLLGLLAHQVRRDDESSALARATHVVTAPVTHGVLAVTSLVRSAWRDYVAAVGAGEELKEARRRIERLEAERSRALELMIENRRLRELVDMKASPPFKAGIAAPVIADIGKGPLRRRVIVGRGRADGVRTGWIATVGGAVVGRVVAARRSTSDVMLIVDPDSGVAVRHQLDRYAGVLRGGNEGPARLEYVPRDQALAVGDPLVTSGLDGLYPPGLLVGYVREMFARSPLTWGVAVEVAFDPETLEEVLLIPPRGELPDQAREEPRP
jgi:rod shape-determining protein MreC